MPMFDYYCKKCHKLYEIHVSLSENGKEIKCPHCEEILKKMLSTPYFVVK